MCVCALNGKIFISLTLNMTTKVAGSKNCQINFNLNVHVNKYLER